jgi:hypothetical protein
VPVRVEGNAGGGVPSCAWTALTLAPWAISRDAQVWRRSYTRRAEDTTTWPVVGSALRVTNRPARTAAGLKYRLVHFPQRIGPPSGAGNTRSSSP